MNKYTRVGQKSKEKKNIKKNRKKDTQNILRNFRSKTEKIHFN